MNWVIENSLVAGGLALCAWLVCRFLGPRPALAHTLWLVVLVKLVCPPVVQLTLPVASPAFLLDSSLESAPRGVGSVSLPATEPMSSPPVVPWVLPTPQRVAAAASPEVAVPAPSPSPSPWPWFGLAWGLGATLVFASCIAGVRRVRRELRQSQEAPAWLLDEARDLAARLGVCLPQVRIVDGLRTAFVWSIGRPVLAWPRVMLNSADRRCTRTVLAHELAHIKRRDHWIARFEIVVAAVLWWHPLFWWARSHMRQQAELACDAWAVWAVPAGRRVYAAALIDAVDESNPEVSALPVLGSRLRAGRDLEQRLTMILRSDVPRHLSRWAVLPVAALSMTLFAGLGFAQEKEPGRAPPRAEKIDLDDLSTKELIRLQKAIERRLDQPRVRRKRIENFILAEFNFINLSRVQNALQEAV